MVSQLRYIYKVIILLFTITLLSLLGCMKEKPLESVIENYKFSYNAIQLTCESELTISYVNSYEKYLSSEIVEDYNEDYFEQYTLIYVSGVQGGLHDIMSIKDIFIFKENLNIVYWSEGSLTAIYCYDFLIELDKNIDFQEINLYKSTDTLFVANTNSWIKVYENKDAISYIIFKDGDQYYISETLITKHDDSVTLSQIFFEGISSTHEEIEISIGDGSNIHFEYRGYTFQIQE